MSFSLIGTGSAVPARKVTNDELARMVDTSDEWIRTRTGVAERRVLTDETLYDLVLAAARAALEDARVGPDELDFILCATVRGDWITPSMACALQKGLGASCPALDINGACSGFLYALDVADGYFARKRARKVLVVACEALSLLTDWADRATCVLFGDAAGAVVLSEGEDLLALRLNAAGNTEHLVIPNVTGNSPFSPREQRPSYIYMNGQEVYKFAVSSMCADIAAVLADAGVSQEEVGHVLPHQANRRIVEAAITRLAIPHGKYLMNMERFGNTSAASIPLLLDENRRAGTFHKGELLVFAAFGGGFTSGACVLRWNMD